MGLDEKAVYTNRGGGPCQGKDVFSLPTGGIRAGEAGYADYVSHVKDHRVTVGTHLWKTAVIADQIAVAKHGAALGKHYLMIANFMQFADGDGKIGGSHELGFFDINRFACAPQRESKLSLLGEVGGQLQNVEDGCGFFHFGGGVDVRENGYGKPALNLGQLCKTELQPRTLERSTCGAVIFEIAGFKDIAHAIFLCQVAANLAHFHAQFLAFQHTGTGNEQQGSVTIYRGCPTRNRKIVFHCVILSHQATARASEGRWERDLIFLLHRILAPCYNPSLSGDVAQLVRAHGSYPCCPGSESQHRQMHYLALSIWSLCLAATASLWSAPSPDKTISELNSGQITAAALAELCAQAMDAGDVKWVGAIDIAIPEDSPARQNAALLAQLGAAHLVMGNDGKARLYLTTAMELDRSNPDVHNNLGVIYRHKGQYMEAETELRAAVALAPLRAEPHYNLAVVLLRLNRTTEAVTELMSALEDKEYSPARKLGGFVALEMKQNTQAVELLEEYFRLEIEKDEDFTDDEAQAWLAEAQSRVEAEQKGELDGSETKPDGNRLNDKVESSKKEKSKLKGGTP